jgi:hypothetical protein
VPDSCRTVIDRRFLLEESIDEVKDEVRSILDRLKRERPKFDYSIRDLLEVQPLMTERDAPVVEAVAEGIREIFGKEPDYVISPGTYDQKHVARIGHLHDCIAYGPGVLDLAHRPDEWVGIEDMVQSPRLWRSASTGCCAAAGRDRPIGHFVPPHAARPQFHFTQQRCNATNAIYSPAVSRFDRREHIVCRETVMTHFKSILVATAIALACSTAAQAARTDLVDRPGSRAAAPRPDGGCRGSDR